MSHETEDAGITCGTKYEEVLREAMAYDCWGGADARDESGLFDDEESLH